MRISDEDRRRAVDELEAHLAAGRIGIDDYVERVAEVMGAETLADVDHARRDLPFMRIALPSRSASRGRQRFADGARSSRLTVVLAALLVVAAVVVALTAQIAWVALLLGGWVLGVVQGRTARSRR